MISYLLFEQDDEEPKDEALSPDGGYIPRILFLGTEGLESPFMFVGFLIAQLLFLDNMPRLIKFQ